MIIMDLYGGITLIIELSMIVTIFSCLISSGYSKVKKILSILLCLNIMICALCEYLGVMFNSHSEYKNYHTTVKWIELSLAPITGILPGFILERNTDKPTKLQFCVIAIFVLNLILETVSAFTGIIFKVDSNSIYSHGPCYFLYAITYFISVIYFLYSGFKVYVHKRLRFLIPMFALTIFIVISFVIQLVNKDLKIDWLTIAIGVIFVFKFNGDMLANTDSLTHLFNKAHFDNTLKNASKEVSIIFFDVDSFKEINDTYGHTKGDEILVKIASLLMDVYSKYGIVYRYGGDEFAVILRNPKYTDMLNKKFGELVEEAKKEDELFPYVSYGSSLYNPYGGIVVDAIDEADRKMYEQKRDRKAIEG